MTDPLAQVVDLLRPDLSYAKAAYAAGAWGVHRSEAGQAFFCAVLEGAVRLEVDDVQPLAIGAGDLALIPAAYDFTVSSMTAEPPPWGSNLPFEVGPDLFRLGDQKGAPDARMLIGHCSFGSPDARLLVSLLPTVIHARGEPRLLHLIRLAMDELRGDRPAREAIVPRLMEVLFIETLRSAGPDLPTGILRGLGDERIAAAIGRIHAEPTVSWTIPALAQAAGMSRSTFFDRFRRMVGMPPMEYLLHWRMVLAKQMLEESGVSISEAAHRVGYASASTFSVAFSRHVGKSPSGFVRGALASTAPAGL
jgi:AraC-like DNA-binding protein